MIRKMAMLGLVAGFLSLGGCALGETQTDGAVTDGAAARAASDAAPATCPVSGVESDCDGGQCPSESGGDLPGATD